MAEKSGQNKSGVKVKNDTNHGHLQQNSEGRMTRIFGFDFNDLSSWEKFVCLMNRPCDPSSLAVWRIMFGEFN